MARAGRLVESDSCGPPAVGIHSWTLVAPGLAIPQSIPSSQRSTIHPAQTPASTTAAAPASTAPTS